MNNIIYISSWTETIITIREWTKRNKKISQLKNRYIYQDSTDVNLIGYGYY